MSETTPAVPPQPASPTARRPERTPALVRLYFAGSFVWTRMAAVLQAAFDGVWLGVLGRASLYRIDERFYDGNAPYHGDDHNLRGLMPWEADALDDAFGGCRRLLVLGAGGGREVLALARRGFDVEGYECNQALAEYAAGFLARHQCAATVRHLPRDAVPAAGEPFDGIILGWGAYMLIPGRAARIDLLRRLRPLVRPGGPILLSFWTRGADKVRFRISAAVANLFRVPFGRERVEMGDALQPNYVHFFIAPEVAGELREAGWEPHRYTPAGSGGRDSAWAVGLASADAAPAPAGSTGNPATTV
jgi:SAM-dependent methyltransferase